VQELLQGKHREKALAEIDREIENVRLAWRWLVAQERVDALEQCLETLFMFYDLRGWLKEGEEAFRLAAERLAGTERTPERDLLLAKLLAPGEIAAANWRL
jgi:hypothetical protein